MQKVLKMPTSALWPHHTHECPGCQMQLLWGDCELAPSGAAAQEGTQLKQDPQQSRTAEGPGLSSVCAWRCSGSLWVLN